MSGHPRQQSLDADENPQSVQILRGPYGGMDRTDRLVPGDKLVAVDLGGAVSGSGGADGGGSGSGGNDGRGISGNEADLNPKSFSRSGVAPISMTHGPPGPKPGSISSPASTQPTGSFKRGAPTSRSVLAEDSASDVRDAAAVVAAAAASDATEKGVPVAVWICMSVLSSTFLILTNKFIMKSYDFTFVYSLTALHFFSGWMFLSVVSTVFKAFTPKSIGAKENTVVAGSAVGSVALMNLSLQYNSVGTYQMLKLIVVPACMTIQYFFHGARFALPIILSLLVMLVGVAVATVTDVSFNSLGLCVGLAAVVMTALFAIWQGSKQKQHSVHAQQLLHSIAPFQTMLAGICALLFDFTGEKSVFTHEFYSQEVVLILISCLIAVSVNLCSMQLIGKTSAVTYQVVGHAKTCCILIAGYVFVPGPPESPLQILKHFSGVAVGLVGVFAYSYFKVIAAKK